MTKHFTLQHENTVFKCIQKDNFYQIKFNLGVDERPKQTLLLFFFFKRNRFKMYPD